MNEAAKNLNMGQTGSQSTAGEAASLDRKIMVDTAHLMALLDCGKHTALKIGHEAKACVRLDRKLFWNVRQIQKYVDNISK